MSRILTVAKRIILQFRRDHRTLGLLVGAPIILIGLVGVLIRSGSGTIELGIVNEDRGFSAGPVRVALAEVLVKELKDDSAFRVSELSRADAERELDAARLDAVLVFGANFSEGVARSRQARLELVLEGSNPSTGGSVAQQLSRVAVQAVAQNAPGGAAPSGPPLDLQVRYLHGGEQFDTLDYFAPAFIGIFVFFLVFLLTTVSFLRERAQGTMERLLATPVNRVELVLGYMAGFGLFALAQSLVVLLFTVFVLRIHTAGNLALVFVVEAVLAIGAINLGIFLSTFARNELQVVQFIPLVITPQALLGDVIWPIESMPAPLQAIGQVLPITYAVRALRAVMIRGDGLDAIWPHLLILAGFALLMVVLAATTLRREIA